MSLLGLGFVAFAVCVAVAVVLRVLNRTSDAFALGLCTIGLLCVYFFPKAGSEFKAKLPGGVELETIAQRAEQAADKAVASKEEVQRLAAEVAAASQRIDAVQGDLRAALKAVAEGIYLSAATKNLFPPPDFVSAKVDEGLNALARYALPDPQQRTAWIEEMQGMVKNAQEGRGPAIH